MATLPFVIAEKDGKERQFDIFSLLLRDRIIFINGIIIILKCSKKTDEKEKYPKKRWSCSIQSCRSS